MTALAFQRSVAIQTCFPAIQSQRLGVALSAADLFMRAFQNELCLGVIERA